MADVIFKHSAGFMGTGGKLLRTRQIIGSNYGLLYNWNVVNGGIFRSGWHVPTRLELTALISAYGGTSVAGGHLKAAGTTYWATPNTGADNSFGFNAKGTGTRGAAGNFSVFNVHGNFWTSDSLWGTHAYIAYITNTSAELSDAYLQEFMYGNIIRLFKDDSTWSPGDTVIIDGTTYATIKIGDIVCLSSNLKATHYYDGDPIPEVTDNTAWVALTTPGLCAYNNNWANV